MPIGFFHNQLVIVPGLRVTLDQPQNQASWRSFAFTLGLRTNIFIPRKLYKKFKRKTGLGLYIDGRIHRVNLEKDYLLN